MLRGIAIPLLTLAVIGLGVWGYQENQEKNAILVKAENQYQSAFHNLNYHIDALNEELGKALAVNSRTQITPSLTNVWRLTYAAQLDLGQLPLSLASFSQTEQFLANLGDFTYRAAVRDLEKEPLSEKEWKTLQTLYERSEQIKKELNKIQSKIIENNLRWMDVELALAQEEKSADNTIIDGLKTIDKNVEEFGEVDWGVISLTLNERKKQAFQNLPGKEITAEEAKEIAQEFMDKILTDLSVQENGQGMEYQSYTVVGRPVTSKERVYLDITKKGGHVVWWLFERPVGQASIDQKKAELIAADYLAQHGHENMVPINIQPYDSTCIIVFAPMQDDVLLVNENISVKVALDNGEVLGYDAKNYLQNHRDREIPQPKLSPEEAKGYVSPRLGAQLVGLAMVEDDKGEDVLAYLFQGQLNGHTYRVYIDAQNGREVEVENIKNIDSTKL